MAYTWTPDLATGNTSIDSQHKELIKAINDLLEACSSGKGRDTLDSTLKFLSDYTAKHFSDEEKLQQKYRYPDSVNHKKLHDSFKKDVAKLSKELHEKGANIAIVSKVNSSIGDWLKNHIKREDTKVAAHIKANS